MVSQKSAHHKFSQENIIRKNGFETIARHEASQKQPPGVKQSGSLSEQH